MVKVDSRSVQPEFGVVRFRNDPVFRLEGGDHDHWSKDLFLDYWRVLWLVGEDDWLDQERPICALACLFWLVGVLFAKLDVSLDGFVLRLIGLRSVINLSICGIAERSAAC